MTINYSEGFMLGETDIARGEYMPSDMLALLPPDAAEGYRDAQTAARWLGQTRKADK